MPSRLTTCAHCGGPLRTAGATYCSGRCRIAAFRARQRGGLRPAVDAGDVWCVGCDRARPIGRLDGSALVLLGQWEHAGDAWRWSVWAKREEHRIELPAVVRCPDCRSLLNVTAPAGKV
jgi:hypothetical protein